MCFICKGSVFQFRVEVQSHKCYKRCRTDLIQPDRNVSFGHAIQKLVKCCSILMYPPCSWVWVTSAKIACSCKASGSRRASALDGAGR